MERGYRFAKGWTHTLHVTLTPEDRATLEAWTRKRTLPPGMVRRVWVVLLRADGVPYREIERRTGLGLAYCYRWVRRFRAEGVQGLWTRPNRPLREAS